jgi:hypothetical protein
MIQDEEHPCAENSSDATVQDFKDASHPIDFGNHLSGLSSEGSGSKTTCWSWNPHSDN